MLLRHCRFQHRSCRHSGTTTAITVTLIYLPPYSVRARTSEVQLQLRTIQSGIRSVRPQKNNPAENCHIQFRFIRTYRRDPSTVNRL